MLHANRLAMSNSHAFQANIGSSAIRIDSTVIYSAGVVCGVYMLMEEIGATSHPQFIHVVESFVCSTIVVKITVLAIGICVCLPKSQWNSKAKGGGCGRLERRLVKVGPFCWVAGFKHVCPRRHWTNEEIAQDRERSVVFRSWILE